MEQGTDAFVPYIKICRAPAAEASAPGARIPSKPKDREVTTTSLTKSRGAGHAGDKVFSAATLAAGCLILVVLFGVALFLVIQALPALVAPADKIQGGEGFFTPDELRSAGPCEVGRRRWPVR